MGVVRVRERVLVRVVVAVGCCMCVDHTTRKEEEENPLQKEFGSNLLK